MYSEDGGAGGEAVRVGAGLGVRVRIGRWGVRIRESRT